MKQILFPIIFCGMASALLAGGSPGGPWANGAYYPGQLDGRYSANVYNDAQAGGGIFSTNAFTVATNLVTSISTLIDTNTTPPSAVLITNVNTVVTTNITSPAGQNVVSGILGFAVRNGTPAVTSSSNSSAAALPGAGTVNSSSSAAQLAQIGLDPSMNYFLVYVNGDVYAGQTAANINPRSSSVNGALVNGSGRNTYQLFTNQTTDSGGGVANTGVEVISLPTATASGYFNAKVKNNKSPYIFKGNGEISVHDSGSSIPGDRVYPFKVDGIKASENSASASTQTGRITP